MSQILKLTYKIYLEAEDITQSRIAKTTSFVKNLFENCQNTYFKQVEIDDENDLDDFVLRLYVDHTVEEEVCKNEQDAKTFLGDMMEFLDAIAAAHSYLDMEGSFGIEYADINQKFKFTSEFGQDYCDFTEE